MERCDGASDGSGLFIEFKVHPTFRVTNLKKYFNASSMKLFRPVVIPMVEFHRTHVINRALVKLLFCKLIIPYIRIIGLKSSDISVIIQETRSTINKYYRNQLIFVTIQLV